MSRLRVGICGLGTVGSGTFNLLKKNRDLIAKRAGCAIETVMVASRQDHPDCDLSDTRVSRDVFELACDAEVDLVVELIGGTDVARELTLSCIEQGKQVVTANKALIAEHGNEILQAARQRGVTVAYEAAIAGGIPVVKAIREGLAANAIQSLVGIINGTSNYILTEMHEQSRGYAEVLSEAQALGYAEADPTLDVEGIDAAHKLSILASLAIGGHLQFPAVHTEGISQLNPLDFRLTDELGYVIKHLGIARRTQAGMEQRVHPTLLPKTSMLARVRGVMNAVQVHGDAAGETFYYGAGAGSLPTASSVVADIIDLARQLGAVGGQRPFDFAMPDAQDTNALSVLPMEEVETASYLRFKVEDRPGVMAELSGVLSAGNIDIDAILQPQATDADGLATICLITDRVREGRLNEALGRLEALPGVKCPPIRIRVESDSGS